MEDDYIKDAIKTISNQHQLQQTDRRGHFLKQQHPVDRDRESADLKDLSNGLTSLSTREIVNLMANRGLIELKTPILMDPAKSCSKQAETPGRNHRISSVISKK